MHRFGHTLGININQVIEDSKILLKQEDFSLQAYTTGERYKTLQMFKCPVCKK